MAANVAGRIFQISVSDGGVPKLARPQATITALGLSGDRQRSLDVHGGPERALCLYSLERLLALQAEGHPVFAGAMGENLMLSGLDWAQVRPGTRLRLGEQALIEISKHTTPCSNLKPYFLEGDYSRVSQKRHPGWSRLYARVLQPGEVRVSDPVWLVEA